ncbi:MAG: YlxR family protein [Anaerolineae bacterium]|nr:YlxR family protein [Anaerolineae bacterium]
MARQEPNRKQRGPGRPRHIPQRTCVVCRRTLDKRALVRIVRTPDEGVIVDPTGKRAGRGAYLCHEDQCWEQAFKTHVLDRALRAELTDTDRARLREQRPCPASNGNT